MATQTIKAAIIDDEMHCIKTLRHLLGKQFPEILIVFTASDSSLAKDLVEEHKPDIVFLDIEMPGMNGIQFLSQFAIIPFAVVFTTAYDTYAIKAIKLNALDYLLKPVNRHELGECIEKYKSGNNNTSKEQVTYLQLFKEKRIKNTIALSAMSGLTFVKITDIMYLEAENTYTHVILQNNTQYLVSKTLASFEEILSDDPSFFKAHKSYIINLGYVRQYLRGEGGEIIMANDKRIALSRNNKEAFLQLFIKL